MSPIRVRPLVRRVGGPPPLPTLVRASQWANSLGNNSTAFRDGTNFDATVIGTGGQSAVVTAASLGLVDWPTANAWACRANGVDWTNTTQTQWDLGVPVPGDRRWFRHYYQCPIPNTVTPNAVLGNLEHGHETADAALGGGDGYAPIRLPMTDGTFFFGYREISTGFRYYWNSTFLQKFTTYRIEWDVRYGVGSYQLGCKVWSAADVLLLDSDNAALGGDLFSQYLPVANPALFLRNQVFALADFADHRYLRFGNNGPSTVNFPSVGVVAGTPMHYYGAAAVSFTSSCGPYVPGNG